MIDTLAALAIVAHRGMEWLIIPFLVLCLGYTWFSAKPPVPQAKPDPSSSTKKSPERKKPSMTSKVFRILAYIIAASYSIIVATTWLTSITLMESDQVLVVVRTLFVITGYGLLTIFTLALMRKYIRVTRQVNRLITAILLAVVMLSFVLPVPVFANLVLANHSADVALHVIVAPVSLSASLAGILLMLAVSMIKRKSRS